MRAKRGWVATMSELHLPKELAPLFAALAITLGLASSARADTPTPTPNQMRVCLRGDMTGLTDRLDGNRGTGAEWPLWGIRVEVRVASSGAIAVPSRFADLDDGCFLMTVPYQATAYHVRVRPRAELAEENYLEVQTAARVSPLLVANAVLGGAGTTHEVVFGDNEYIRMFAVYAYGIQHRFRGDFEGQTIYPVLDGGCTTPNSACSIDGARVNHIASPHRKFLMMHEYGHSNLSGAGAFMGGNDCNGDGHGMRSVEHSSCAAMEGWAHFVAAEVFNDHDDADGELRYWTGGASLVTLEHGTGVCGTGYPEDYALDCTTASTPEQGVELDWMRQLWDFRRNPEPNLSPAAMQDIFRDTGGWGDGDVYEQVRDGLPAGTLRNRWESYAEANGICEGSGC